MVTYYINIKLNAISAIANMDFYNDITYSNATERKSSEDDSSNLLRIKIAELEKMKKDLKQAKDAAMQSWLDSRPLIDELEKMQAELASAKGTVLKANTLISELRAQLGTTEMCIKSAKEEEQKFRAMINENNQALRKAQDEMEQLKMKIDEKRRRRSKLKLVLRSKRLSLQTLQLTYEAVVMESEAFRTSAAQALGYMENSEATNVMVRIPLEEYEFLKREANEQNSLAEWRISVAAEEKLAADNSRDAAYRRLHTLYPRNVSGVRNTAEQRTHSENTTEKIEEMAVPAGGRTHRNRSPRAQTKSKVGVNRRNPQQQSKSSNYGNPGRKRKSSIFVRIKTFFVQKLSKYFK